MQLLVVAERPDDIPKILVYEVSVCLTCSPYIGVLTKKARSH
jgi:hypothetical protein